MKIYGAVGFSAPICKADLPRALEKARAVPKEGTEVLDGLVGLHVDDKLGTLMPKQKPKYHGKTPMNMAARILELKKIFKYRHFNMLSEKLSLEFTGKNLVKEKDGKVRLHNQTYYETKLKEVRLDKERRKTPAAP